MTLKAIAAALALLPVLAGAIHHVKPAADSRSIVVSEQTSGTQHSTAKPPAAAEKQDALLFVSVVDAAKQAGRTARAHSPEPKMLLLLGLVLLLFGLRRGKQHRNGSAAGR